jgi:putative iron-only hydrogenase system regulator
VKKIAVISAILESPQESQQEFNNIVSEHKDIIKGRIGLPFEDTDTAVIAISVVAEMDRINAFTGKLGNVPNVTVKTAVSRKDVYTA